MRGGRGRNGQARHAIKRPSVRGRARCPETIGVCNTAGERRGAALCQGTRPCRTPPRHICSRLFHMHTSVEGHQALQPSWSINGFSTPLHSTPLHSTPLPVPASPPAGCRRMCLRSPAPQPSGALVRTSAAEVPGCRIFRAVGPGVSSGAWPRSCRRDERRPYMREKRASRRAGAAL